MSVDDKSFELGHRQAWRSMLKKAVQELNYDNDLEAGKVAWIIEREEILYELRLLCNYFGDNDWPNELHLGDVITKHLANHLYDKYEAG